MKATRFARFVCLPIIEYLEGTSRRGRGGREIRQGIIRTYLGQFGRACLGIPTAVFLTLFCFVLPFESLLGQVQEIRAEASFSPPSITLSDKTSYKVVLHGTQDLPSGSIPSIPGLKISNSPQIFRSASLIDGTPSVRLEMSFQVSVTKEGSFALPSWKMNVREKNLQIPKATLQVLKPGQLDSDSKKSPSEQKDSLEDAAFLEFSSPRSFLFEGETVPVSLKLFLWDKLPVTRLLEPPVKNIDRFSISASGKPNQKRNVSRNSKTYTVLSWPADLTATTAGQHKMSFSTSIRVRVKKSRKTPFNSPFLNDPFFGFGREETLIVTGDEITMEVRPLPIKGRPTAYTGAVGVFTTNSSLSSPLKKGTPSLLNFSIQGEGNFHFFSAPVLSSTNELDIGPPSFVFPEDGNRSQNGTLNILYPLTPKHSGSIEIPTVPFSFFDPSNETYVAASAPAKEARVDSGVPGVASDDTEVVFLLDLSASMLSLDMTGGNKPELTRLDVVKEAVGDFIEKRQGARVALLAFSVNPYLVSGLTLDKEHLRKNLDRLRVGLTQNTGTNIGSALAGGINRLRSLESKSKILILLTDGKDEPPSSHSPLILAEGAKKDGIKVYTIAIGSNARTRTYLFAPTTRDLMRYTNGTPVIDVAHFPIDKEILRKIAIKTGAKFYEANSALTLREALLDIDAKLLQADTKKVEPAQKGQRDFLYERLLQEAKGKLRRIETDGEQR